jgi:pimeloyl-ACP methyl ester carboxylesterase
VTSTVLTSADGVRLAARWWQPAAPSGEAVVLVHGFAAGKDDPTVEQVALRLVSSGRRVLTFDLRGHGQSSGLCALGGHERLDVDAAVAEARLDSARVVVVGASMGGIACLAHLAVGTPDGPGAAAGRVADGAVVVATPARWQVPRSARGALSAVLTQTRPGRAMVARRTGTRLAVRPSLGAPPVVRIKSVSRPVAVLHGLDDRFLSPAAARALFAAAPEPRLLDLVPGMGHGFCAAALAPIEAAVAWVVGSALAGAS